MSESDASTLIKSGTAFVHTMIGSKLAHYESTAHLGSGGMRDVYQATDTKLGRSVAIKFLPESFANDSERVARFQREARVLASLKPLAGTDGASFPFWSPDSRYIAFFADGKLKKIDASGGPALTLADAFLNSDSPFAPY